VFTVRPAHVQGWLQACAKCGPFGFSKDPAALVFAKLNASDAGRFSIRHAWYRAGNRWGGAAGAAVGAAIHAGHPRVVVFVMVRS